ncbi:MAG: hypothetical protein R3E89_12570 [Thiolinea sp.]
MEAIYAELEQCDLFVAIGTWVACLPGSRVRGGGPLCRCTYRGTESGTLTGCQSSVCRGYEGMPAGTIVPAFAERALVGVIVLRN